MPLLVSADHAKYIVLLYFIFTFTFIFIFILLIITTHADAYANAYANPWGQLAQTLLRWRQVTEENTDFRVISFHLTYRYRCMGRMQFADLAPKNLPLPRYMHVQPWNIRHHVPCAPCG